MNRRLATILLSAFLVAAGCSYLVWRLVVTRIAAAQPAKTTHLVAANRDIPLGTVLRPGDLTTVDIAGSVPKGAIVDTKKAIGRGVVSDLHEGEPILDSRLAAEGSGGGLAATIPPGMRAVAVRVNDIVGVAGFVIPGTKVDLLIAGTPPKGNGGLGDVTKTLMQNVEVLSAGQNITKDAEGKPISVGVVNMLVTPEQAEVLSLASNETRIQLILRNPMDKDETNTKGTTVSYLYENKNGLAPAGGKAAPVPSKGKRVAAAPPPPPPVKAKPEPPPPPIVVEVIHGSSRVESKFVQEKGKSASEGQQE